MKLFLSLIFLGLLSASPATASAWLGHGPDAPKLPSAQKEVGVWQPLEITAKPMGSPGKENDVAFTINRLKWQGGLVLTSRNADFGGFSGLRLSEGGSSVTMISDRARWLKAGLLYEENGAIAGLEKAAIATMMRYNGEELTGTAGDAEGLELIGGGKAVVSFERYHRVDRYRTDEAGRYVFDQRLLHNRLVKGLAGNSSLEAVLLLKDSRMLTLAEGSVAASDLADDEAGLFQGDARPGWISAASNWETGGDDWQPLAYETAPGFSVTDLAQDPESGAVFVLERAFSRAKGVRARVTRIDLADIKPGTLLKGEELAQLNMVQGIDNMEGLDLRRLPDGRLMLYMISDDNFNVAQRTVLLSWEVLPE